MEKPDIVKTAQALGYLPEKQTGNRYQGGNCPAGHESVNKRCWIIYPDTQSCYCNHCHIGGDAYNLIKAALNCNFTESVSWAKENGLISGNGHGEANYTALRKATKS